MLLYFCVRVSVMQDTCCVECWKVYTRGLSVFVWILWSWSFLGFRFPTEMVFSIFHWSYTGILIDRKLKCHCLILTKLCCSAYYFVCSHFLSHKTKEHLKKCELRIKFAVMNWLEIPVQKFSLATGSYGWKDCTAVVL